MIHLNFKHNNFSYFLWVAEDRKGKRKKNKKKNNGFNYLFKACWKFKIGKENEEI